MIFQTGIGSLHVFFDIIKPIVKPEFQIRDAVFYNLYFAVYLMIICIIFWQRLCSKRVEWTGLKLFVQIWIYYRHSRDINRWFVYCIGLIFKFVLIKITVHFINFKCKRVNIWLHRTKFWAYIIIVLTNWFNQVSLTFDCWLEIF